jgi:Ser/Thr protein kinase RdoA (MazF antagonist)
MSFNNANANAVAAAFANAMFAQLAAAQPAPAKPLPRLNANQLAIVNAIAAGRTTYASIARAVGMTKRQTQSMANGLLFAGVITSTGGTLAIA